MLYSCACHTVDSSQRGLTPRQRCTHNQCTNKEELHIHHMEVPALQDCKQQGPVLPEEATATSESNPDTQGTYIKGGHLSKSGRAEGSLPPRFCQGSSFLEHWNCSTE